MGNQSEQTGLGVQKTDRLAVVVLSLGFLFLCASSFVALDGSLLFGIPLVAVGFIAIIYGSIKIKLNNPGQFFVGFIGWFIFSFLINVFIVFNLFENMFIINLFSSTHVDQIGTTIDNPQAVEIGMIAILVVVQLLGYGLTFLTFRKNKRWMGIGIIIASIPYLIGFIMRSGCAPAGLPFPLSLFSFC